jgi:hypothetical protein
VKIYIPQGTKLVPLDSYDSTRNVIDMPCSMVIDALYWGYLTQDTIRNLDESLLQELQKERYLIIHFKRKYWLVLKSEVEAEKY